MNDSQNNPQPNAQSTPDWFADVQPSLPARSPKHKTVRIVVIVSGVVLVGLGALIVTMFASGQRTACLTESDYALLTGTTLEKDSFSSATSFYTTPISFTPGKSTYLITNGVQPGLQTLQKIADAYKALPSTSILVTINGNYFAEDAAQLAQSRLEMIQSSLASMGVPSNLITVQSPTYTPPEDESPSDTTEALVSVTSASTCAESEE
jgi:hypothetical protein